VNYSDSDSEFENAENKYALAQTHYPFDAAAAAAAVVVHTVVVPAAASAAHVPDSNAAHTAAIAPAQHPHVHDSDSGSEPEFVACGIVRLDPRLRANDACSVHCVCAHSCDIDPYQGVHCDFYAAARSLVVDGGVPVCVYVYMCLFLCSRIHVVICVCFYITVSVMIFTQQRVLLWLMAVYLYVCIHVLVCVCFCKAALWMMVVYLMYVCDCM
jgi:hypothetical protein